jgi:hypothetical protein
MVATCWDLNLNAGNERIKGGQIVWCGERA